MNVLKLVSCNASGEMKLTFNEHVINTNVKNIFKWKSGTLDKSTPFKKEIDDQLYKYLNLINLGGRRVKSK